MKRVLSIVITAVFLIQTAVIGAFSVDDDLFVVLMNNEESGNMIHTYSTPLLAGDINGDNLVSSADKKILTKKLVGEESEGIRFAFDLNGDGIVSAKDSSVMSQVLSGIIKTQYISNTTVKKSYQTEEDALELYVDDAKDTDALFEIDTSFIEIQDYSYVAVVWKSAEKSEIGFIGKGNSTEYCDNVSQKQGNDYSYITFSLPENSADMKLIEVKYDSAPTKGKSIYIDSIIFSKTLEKAEEAADERLLNHSSKEKKPVTIEFNSSEALSAFTNRNMTALICESETVKIISAGTSDTRCVLNLEEYGICADDYKYIVYTTMLPSTDTQSYPSGKLTFYVGNIVRGETEKEYSIQYNLINDGIFHSSVIEMTDAAFWSGTVHEIMINNFVSPTIGSYHYIKSISFCSSYEQAIKIREGRTEETTDVRQLFDYGIYEDGTMQMSYRYYIPYDYNKNICYPVLTALHGAGQRGIDGVSNIKAGFSLMLNNLTDVARNSIIFAPQCPEGTGWAGLESNWYNGSYSISNVPETDAMKAALKILDNLSIRFSTDKDRYYVTGFSMGGYGTWDLLTRHPDMFAAGMPLCGGGDYTFVSPLLDIPIWAFHGTKDSTVPKCGTQDMYNSIIKAGGTKIKYTPLDGYDHNIWDCVYANEEYMEWLFSQKLSNRSE